MFCPDDDDFCYKRVQTPGMSLPRAGGGTSLASEHVYNKNHHHQDKTWLSHICDVIGQNQSHVLECCLKQYLTV